MAPGAPTSLTQRWLRAVPALRDLGLRAAYFRAELDRHATEVLALALNELAGRAEQANPIAREVLAAAVPMLADPQLAARVEALRSAAAGLALLSLDRLLRFRSRGPTDGAEIDERKVAASSSGRVLTLGERRALARRPSRAVLEKLLLDPHPMVIRNVLRNPRLTEDDVLRLAARRPAYPDVIAEIAGHPSWSSRARVRMAIVQNPGSPPEIVIPMLALLIRPELGEVVAAADVPAAVRAAARELLLRRPPVPERGGKGAPQ